MDFLEAEHRIQIDSIHVNQKFRDYYGQALMTVQTFNGRILEKDRTGLLFRNPIQKLKQSEELGETITPSDAKDFILKNFWMKRSSCSMKRIYIRSIALLSIPY